MKMGATVAAVLFGMLACGAASAEQQEYRQAQGINAKRIDADIRLMRNRGMSTEAIRYIFELDGIRVPPQVLLGRVSAEKAIEEGSLRRISRPASVTPPPPPLPATPKPDLTPRGSSSPDWKPAITGHDINELRAAVTSRSRPPGC